MDVGSITQFSPLPLGERDRMRGNDDLKKAAQEFESYFISYMLKVMRESMPKDSLLGGGKGEEIYRSFQDEELAKRMVESGGIGLTEVIMRNLSRTLKSGEDSADKEIAYGIVKNKIGGKHEDK